MSITKIILKESLNEDDRSFIFNLLNTQILRFEVEKRGNKSIFKNKKLLDAYFILDDNLYIIFDKLEGICININDIFRLFKKTNFKGIKDENYF